MEELVRSRLIEIEVKDKKYILGYPTRKDAIIAENCGLDVIGDNGKILTLSSKLFYTALLAKQPKITEEGASMIMQDYIDEGGDIDEIIQFLTEQYVAFIKSPDGKKKKKAKIVEM